MSRLILPKILVLLIFVALVGRLYQLQLVDTEANRYRYATQVRTTRYLSVPPMRGEVFASDGKTLLAESVPIFTVSVRPADLPELGSHERAELFAQLGQLLDITSTLTISPAAALERDDVLHSDLVQGLGASAVAGAQLHTFSPPLRIPISPAQQADALALAEHYRPIVAFQPDRTAPPASAGSAGEPTPTTAATPILTGTLTISPATSLAQNPALRDDIRQHFGAAALDAAGTPLTSDWATLTVPPNRTLIALKLNDAYSTTLTLDNPIGDLVDQSNIPSYQTLTIKQDIPRDVALVLRENTPSLPGVVVNQDYRRRYPLSGQVQSLSHLLGYIGRVDECDLVRKNPARSWLVGLLDSIGHAAQCGVIQKQINPYQLGIPRYLSDDRIGKDGLEASYEEQLRGQLGIDAVLVDALGRPVRAPQAVQPAHDGSNLVLTIDVGFQQQVEQILRNWIAEGEQRRQIQTGRFAYKRNYQPIRSGVAIVMDVHTGRVLAMVSWPSYDNNLWSPDHAAEWQQMFAPTDPKAQKDLERLAPLTNRAIAGQYPPGSTLKQFDASIILQKGIITPDTLVRDPGKLILEDQYTPGVFYSYPNSVPRDNGKITVAEALMRSSNVFFMSVVGGNKDDHVSNLKPEEKTVDGLPLKDFADGLNWFGFGEPTGIQLAGEREGRVPTPAWKQAVLRAPWTTGDTYNAAIGQGNLEVTPLQLATAGAAVANNGARYRPQLVQAITDSNGKVIQEIKPELVEQIPVDASNFAVVRDGMRRSVTEGVNVAARDDCSGLQIAGKTGTAEFGPNITIPSADGKGTITVRQSHSWFVGFAPYDNPQIEVLVLSEGTGDLGDGSATITVPAVTQIMQAYFNVTPPNPLPRGCQQGMPPLPARTEPTSPTRSP
jgi:penicillin-binding protein 2